MLSGVLQSGYSTGFMLSAIVYSFIYPLVNTRPDFGWRVMLWLGVLPALLVQGLPAASMAIAWCVPLLLAISFGKRVVQRRNAETASDLRAVALTGNVDAAIGHLERAVKVRPDNSAALYQLGLVYKKMGQPEKAAFAMKRFRELNPSAQ